jgi:hypothetical protein
MMIGKNFLASVLVLSSSYACANTLQLEDFSWQETCIEEEMSYASKMPTNVDFVKIWFAKAYEAYMVQPCDKPTVEYLSSPTTTTKVRGNLAGMHSSVTNKSCRNKFRTLLRQLNEWVDELKALLKTNNCIIPNLPNMNLYVVDVPSLNVRADPLTATRSSRLDILKYQHVLTLITRVIGHNDNEWGHFLYELNGKAKFGWLNMKYTRPIVSK